MHGHDQRGGRRRGGSSGVGACTTSARTAGPDAPLPGRDQRAARQRQPARAAYARHGAAAMSRCQAVQPSTATRPARGGQRRRDLPAVAAGAARHGRQALLEDDRHAHVPVRAPAGSPGASPTPPGRRARGTAGSIASRAAAGPTWPGRWAPAGAGEQRVDQPQHGGQVAVEVDAGGVGEVDAEPGPLAVPEDVPAAHVVVEHALAVQLLERLQQVAHDRLDLRDGQRAGRAEQLAPDAGVHDGGGVAAHLVVDQARRARQVLEAQQRRDLVRDQAGVRRVPVVDPVLLDEQVVAPVGSCRGCRGPTPPPSPGRPRRWSG